MEPEKDRKPTLLEYGTPNEARFRDSPTVLFIPAFALAYSVVTGTVFVMTIAGDLPVQFPPFRVLFPATWILIGNLPTSCSAIILVILFDSCLYGFILAYAVFRIRRWWSGRA